MDGPPEVVEGIVMKLMTSCSLRPASRARNPPMAWMPSCELPAIRITASLTVEILGLPLDWAAGEGVLMANISIQFFSSDSGAGERDGISLDNPRYQSLSL